MPGLVTYCLICHQRVISAQCLTFMPGLVTYFLIGDQTVIPAHSKGAASAGLMLSGILTARFPDPRNVSAKPPLFLPPPIMVAAPSGQMFCSQTASIQSSIHHVFPSGQTTCNSKRLPDAGRLPGVTDFMMTSADKAQLLQWTNIKIPTMTRQSGIQMICQTPAFETVNYKACKCPVISTGCVHKVLICQSLHVQHCNTVLGTGAKHLHHYQ